MTVFVVNRWRSEAAVLLSWSAVAPPAVSGVMTPSSVSPEDTAVSFCCRGFSSEKQRVEQVCQRTVK